MYGKNAQEADRLNNETRTRAQREVDDKALQTANMSSNEKAEHDKLQAEEYYSKLAKPKDRWAVGHEL